MEGDLPEVNSDPNKEATTKNSKQKTKTEGPTSGSVTTEDFPNSPRWINNKGEEVKQVFGFNDNAELVNGRAAMFGFLMLILTEIVFHGEPVTKSIFGIS